MKTKKRTPCKRTQKRQGKKHRGGTTTRINNNNRKQKSTQKSTRKEFKEDNLHKRNHIREELKQDNLHKIAYIRSLGLKYRDNSLLRAFVKYKSDAIKDMDVKAVTDIYDSWRYEEANARKINRNLKKMTNSPHQNTVKKKRNRSPEISDAEVEDALKVFRPNHNIDSIDSINSIEDLHNAPPIEDFPLSPGALKTIEGDTYDEYRFTPKRYRDNRTIPLTSTPTDLFKFNPVDLDNTAENEEDDVLGLFK